MFVAFVGVLTLNALWFGAGFLLFGLAPRRAAKLLVPFAARASPLFATLAASVRFLGGLNFAFTVFAVLLLLRGTLFPEPAQRALFATVFALAHASQFAFNLPVALQSEKSGDPLWPVFSGTMLLIFVVDGVLALANALLAAALFAV